MGHCISVATPSDTFFHTDKSMYLHVPMLLLLFVAHVFLATYGHQMAQQTASLSWTVLLCWSVPPSCHAQKPLSSSAKPGSSKLKKCLRGISLDNEGVPVLPFYTHILSRFDSPEPSQSKEDQWEWEQSCCVVGHPSVCVLWMWIDPCGFWCIHTSVNVYAAISLTSLIIQTMAIYAHMLLQIFVNECLIALTAFSGT